MCNIWKCPTRPEEEIDPSYYEKLPDGTYTIPSGENAPTETKPWTNMMNVSPLGDTAVCTYSIDHPVTDNPRYEMCGLRQSYYKITKDLYLKAGKC